MCQASLIEDLLSDGSKFMLTARFQSDSIEKRFGQYCQMTGGRILVGLKDVIWGERILKIKSLVKESIDIESDIKVTENDDAIQQELFDNIREIGFDNVMLSDEAREVAARISGYMAKKLVKKFGHCCKSYCINESEAASTTHVYIDFLSRGGLTLPPECLVTYVCHCFAFIGPVALLKERLWHRCFPVSFVKFLRTPFLQNTSGRLLMLHFLSVVGVFYTVYRSL